jgi:hypothetical protein
MDSRETNYLTPTKGKISCSNPDGTFGAALLEPFISSYLEQKETSADNDVQQLKDAINKLGFENLSDVLQLHASDLDDYVELLDMREYLLKYLGKIIQGGKQQIDLHMHLQRCKVTEQVGQMVLLNYQSLQDFREAMESPKWLQALSGVEISRSKAKALQASTLSLVPKRLNDRSTKNILDPASCILCVSASKWFSVRTFKALMCIFGSQA